MKTIVVYYSYSGHTKMEAERIAIAENADLAAARDAGKRPGTFKAFLMGCPAALRMKCWPIAPLNADLDAYDIIVLMAPVWAGHPAPQFNALVDQLPTGKQVKVALVSGSGQSSAKEKLELRIADKGCKLIGYEDIKEAAQS